MVDRVTNQTRVATAQLNLQSSAALLARLQETASSLNRISRPSDDPTGTADSMRVRAAQSANAQFGRNIDDANSWLATVDSTLSSATNILHRVRDLTVQGANDGSMTPASKEAIAVELEGLKSDLLAQANTKYIGRNIFAGNSDTAVAFNPDFSINATSGQVQRRIDANTTVRVDADGAAVFGVGASSAFALIDKIAADLRSGVNVGYQLAAVDSRLNAVLGEQGAVGARQVQVTQTQGTNMARTGTLEAQRSGIEDVDLGRTVIQLKQQEVTYQAALAVTARTLQPTLMDFLH